MTGAEFDDVVQKRIGKIKATLKSKAKEYARGDRLSNFKTAAAFLEITPEKALQGMRLKHEVSIRDLVNDLDRGDCAARYLWEEKIGDSINYLILLEALVNERLVKL